MTDTRTPTGRAGVGVRLISGRRKTSSSSGPGGQLRAARRRPASSRRGYRCASGCGTWPAGRPGAVRLPGPQGDQGQVQELVPRVPLVDAEPRADPGGLLRPVHLLPPERHPELRHLHVLCDARLEPLPDRCARCDVDGRGERRHREEGRLPEGDPAARLGRARRSCSSCSRGS